MGKFLKTKEQVILERTNSVYESVHKMGDEYRVNGVIIPKSLINSFVSKAKKEYDIDAKENFSEIDLAQMLVDYVMKNYLEIDSLPVKTILGKDNGEDNKIQTEITEEETTFVQPEDQTQIDDIDTQEIPGDDETPSAEIQTEM